MISKIMTIAKTTFLDALRKRVFQVIFIFGVIIILSTQFFTFFTFGEEIKILKDVGMAGITFFSLIISIVLGSSQIQSDIEKKTIYTVLSCPVSRRQYLIGKAIGVICYVTFAILLLSLVFYIALSAKTYSIEKKIGEDARFNFATFAYNVELLKGIYLIIIKGGILVSLAILLSMFFHQTFNIIACFLIYIVGHLTQIAGNLAKSAGKVVGLIMSGFYYLFPNFEFFNISDYIAVGKIISFRYVFTVGAYGILYSVMLIYIASELFSKKEV